MRDRTPQFVMQTLFSALGIVVIASCDPPTTQPPSLAASTASPSPSANKDYALLQDALNRYNAAVFSGAHMVVGSTAQGETPASYAAKLKGLLARREPLIHTRVPGGAAGSGKATTLDDDGSDGLMPDLSGPSANMLIVVTPPPKIGVFSVDMLTTWTGALAFRTTNNWRDSLMDRELHYADVSANDSSTHGYVLTLSVQAGWEGQLPVTVGASLPVGLPLLSSGSPDEVSFTSGVPTARQEIGKIINECARQ